MCPVKAKGALRKSADLPCFTFVLIANFCLAFPWLFPGGIGDIKESRLYELELSNWAENLLYYQDGRFAKDKLWCFLP